MTSIKINLTLTAVPTSPRVPLTVNASTTSSQLRLQAAEATKIPVTTLRLIFRGRLISDGDSPNVVAEYKLEEDCVVHCMGKPESNPTTTTTTTSTPSVAKVSGSAVSVAPTTPPKMGKECSLEEALNILRSSNPSSEYLTAVTTLQKILSNIAEHPMEQKYRKVKIQNAAFQRRLGGLGGGTEAMKASGFVVETSDGEESFVLHPSPEAWPKLVASRETVERSVKEAKSATTPAASAPAPASAPNLGGMPGMPGMPGGITPQMQDAAMNMMSDPNALQSMLQNPMVQQMLQNDSRFANNPALRAGLNQLSSNPAMLQQLSGMMRDPAMQRQLQNMGLGGNMPGGGTSPQQGSTTGAARQQASDEEMTEEEMLQEAIQRSLRES